MTKDKVIRVRATEYDKAVLRALAKKLDNVYIMSGGLSDSDVVRIGIDLLAKQHLATDEVRELRETYYNN